MEPFNPFLQLKGSKGSAINKIRRNVIKKHAYILKEVFIMTRIISNLALIINSDQINTF